MVGATIKVYRSSRDLDLFRTHLQTGPRRHRHEAQAIPYGMERSWLKIENPTYSQAEGRHDFFERRKGPESVRAAKLAANA